MLRPGITTTGPRAVSLVEVGVPVHESDSAGDGAAIASSPMKDTESATRLIPSERTSRLMDSVCAPFWPGRLERRAEPLVLRTRSTCRPGPRISVCGPVCARAGTR